MHSLSHFPGLVLDGLQGCLMCWGCSADTAGEPSALQSERHSWRLSRMLLSVTRVSRDVCECFFSFSSQCFCGLIGSLIFELWCSSWPAWLTALMKRIISDWALMLWSLLLSLSSVNPSCYLASNWIPVWWQFGLTEATLSCFVRRKWRWHAVSVV